MASRSVLPSPNAESMARIAENKGLDALAAAVAALALACAFGAHAGDYRWQVVRAIDGDTVEMNAGADMPPELSLLPVRLRGVDTPEIGKQDAKCDSECEAGKAAKKSRKRRSTGPITGQVHD